MTIRELNISARSKSCLMSAGYKEVEDLKDVDDDTLLAVKNLNQACVAEIRKAIDEYYSSAHSKLHHLFTSESFANAKNKMVQENSSVARRHFYELFAGMVENKTWVSAPVNDRQLLILPFRGGHYISIYSDINNRKPGESRDVLTADINIFIDCLYDNPHLLGIIIDPNQNPVLITRREINGLTIRKDPRLQIKDWGTGMSNYTEKDLMVEEELLDFGIDIIRDNFVNMNNYEILEINRGTDGFPNFALQKDGTLYLMKVDVGITNKPVLTVENREYYVNSCRRFNAKCLYAPLALISSDSERAKAGIALCGDGFYVNFSEVVVLN